MAAVVTSAGSHHDRSLLRWLDRPRLLHPGRATLCLWVVLMVTVTSACERAASPPTMRDSLPPPTVGTTPQSPAPAHDRSQADAPPRTGAEAADARGAIETVTPPDQPEELPTVLRDRLWLSIGGETFSLELALTDQARYQGLSDRRSIPADGGMAFVFPDVDELSFVMRRCLVPIDLIFVDDAGRIVAAHAMTVEPYNRPDFALRRYHSGVPVRYAIELRGGTIRRLGLEIDDVIELPHDRLKSLAR